MADVPVLASKLRRGSDLVLSLSQLEETKKRSDPAQLTRYGTPQSFFDQNWNPDDPIKISQ